MTFLLLAGCTVVTLDALRHVLGGCVFYECGMFQDCFLLILPRFCGSGTSRAAGGRLVGGTPRRQMTRNRQPKGQKWLPFGMLLKAGGIIFQGVFLYVCLVRFL